MTLQFAPSVLLCGRSSRDGKRPEAGWTPQTRVPKRPPLPKDRPIELLMCPASLVPRPTADIRKRRMVAGVLETGLVACHRCGGDVPVVRLVEDAGKHEWRYAEHRAQ
ncbi:hypothetical protein [Agromyces sp. S2-1-8]|uniref:hypothetical protein n=1 Tax=Agromyces sp. S2-1-8 TaxID=2897180 RepID=UPI001E618478|nr:hypothetical protein [Agromyces sp. S2-1-8]MCD5348408.1 hypothetical protein [Agromyces sp. S2-1-8]